MLSRNRLRNAAAIGCLIAALWIPDGRGQNVNQGAPQQQQTKAVDSYADIVAELAVLRTALSDAIEMATKWKAQADRDKPDDDKRQDSDLDAQWWMAIAAVAMAAFTFLQLIVGAVTLRYLYLTFKETRRTARHAIVASRSAHRSVHEAARSANASERAVDAQRDLDRAYMFPGIEPILAKVGEKQARIVQVNMTVHNNGRTVGFLREAYVGFVLDLPGAVSFAPEVGERRETDMAVGGNDFVKIPIIFHIPDRELRFCIGYIRYQDIFRKFHISRFCFRFVKEHDGAIRVAVTGGDPWNQWD
jgi:hypothetical protein